MDSKMLAALREYARSQGWDLLGGCGAEGYNPPSPGLVPYCAFAPEFGEEITVVVGRVQSGFTDTLTVHQNPDGSYSVVGDEHESR